MVPIEVFITDLAFRLDSMGLVGWLDVILVTAVIYALLLLLRRSRAAFVLRGILALAVLLLISTFLLPLPTFDLILWLVLIATLIAMPITLQPELRRLLERIGRQVGFNFLSTRKDVADRIIPPLLRAIENLSSSQTGALIVLEGDVALDEYMRTGVAVDGRVTAELLQTIFHDKTPLHDGAVIVRGDKVETAGAVLPLTNQALAFSRRLGTRHRASVGLSEVSDALVIVVSEETGTISLARGGRLERGMDSNGLRQRLVSFFNETTRDQLRRDRLPRLHWRPPTVRVFIADLFYLLVAFLLALAASTVVNQQRNPAVIDTLAGVPLQIVDMPPDSTLMRPLPSTVSVEYQTLADVQPSLTPDSFQAVVSLDGISADPQRVNVTVTTTVDKVRVVSWMPAAVDVQLAPVVSQDVPVNVELVDQELMSAAYEVVGSPRSTPESVQVTGPAPLIEQIAAVKAVVSLANVSAPIRQTRQVVAVDAAGDTVSDVTLAPAEVEVGVAVRSRLDAKNVGVRVVVEGSPPDGFWLSGLSSSPNSIVVQGDPNVIADMESFVDTLPVDLTDVTGTLEIDTPLALPEGIVAFDSRGTAVTTVIVTARVSERRSDLLVTRTVELINDFGEYEITLEPDTVEVLLSGPVPTLNEIEQNPGLVRVLIDMSDIGPDTQVKVEPEVAVPEGIRVRVIQTTVLVRTGPAEPEPAPAP